MYSGSIPDVASNPPTFGRHNRLVAWYGANVRLVFIFLARLNAVGFVPCSLPLVSAQRRGAFMGYRRLAETCVSSLRGIFTANT